MKFSGNLGRELTLPCGVKVAAEVEYWQSGEDFDLYVYDVEGNPLYDGEGTILNDETVDYIVEKMFEEIQEDVAQQVQENYIDQPWYNALHGGRVS
jgi:hypothetical protein